MSNKLVLFALMLLSCALVGSTIGSCSRSKETSGAFFTLTADDQRMMMTTTTTSSTTGRRKGGNSSIHGSTEAKFSTTRYLNVVNNITYDNITIIPSVALNTSEEFKILIDAGFFDVLVDVRSQSEWDSGHIENATLLVDLNKMGTDDEVSNSSDLAGCEYCTIGVYCNSGGRAAVAITKLQESGFRGRLYNGLGVSQWETAGYELVSTDSVVAPCTVDTAASEECLATWQSYVADDLLQTNTATTPTNNTYDNITIPSVALDTSQEFKDLIDAGFFDVIVDVRSQSEWDSGHIENATLLVDLNKMGTDDEVSNASDLAGCEYCTMGVYCGSGQRAAVAITKLQESGFRGRLYNGLGVGQWETAGFELVTTDSVVAPCTITTAESDECLATWESYVTDMPLQATAPPTMTPLQANPTTTPSEVVIPAIRLETAEEFKQLIDAGFFDVIVDVRSQKEWDNGHIENATLLVDLNLMGTQNEVSSADDLMGCEYCTMGLYCNTGTRAAGAIDKLKEAGFKGRLYNGLGVSQWKDAGYPLVTTESVTAACTVSAAASDMCLVEWETYIVSEEFSQDMDPDESAATSAGSGLRIVCSVFLAVFLFFSAWVPDGKLSDYRGGELDCCHGLGI